MLIRSECKNATGHGVAAPIVADGAENLIHSSEKEFPHMSVELAERIGTNWAELTEWERDCLRQLDESGIRLELLQYLAAASVDNRDEVA